MIIKYCPWLTESKIEQLVAQARVYNSCEHSWSLLLQAQEGMRKELSVSEEVELPSLDAIEAHASISVLEELVDAHKERLDRLYASYQDACFSALEACMPSGFRGRSIELTARDLLPGTNAPVKAMSPYSYARVEVWLQRTTPSMLRLCVSEDPQVSALPYHPSHNLPPSLCRIHHLRRETAGIDQEWSWT